MQDVNLGERTYSVAVTSFPEEGYANVYGRDITKRKLAEEKLQTTMQRFYNVLSGMYAAVLLVTDDGLVEFANQAFCDIFVIKESPASLNGLASQEMIEKIRDAYRQPDEAIARIQEIVRIGEPVKGEEVAMSGGRTCLRDFIPIVVNGISYGRLWHHLDITERKRAEEALQQSRERLDLALSSSRMATFEWDIVKNVRTWSDGVHSLLGTKPETFTGSAEEFFQIIHPEDRSTVQAALARAVETTGLYETEYRAVWPDDSIHHIAARGTVHRDSAGRPVSMTGVCWDITERKRAEMALRLSEEKFSRAFAMNPAAVVLTSLEDGVFLEVNEAFLTIFGFSRDEAVGHSTLELQLWPTSEDRARRVQELREKGSYRDREQIMRRKSGERFMTLASADIFTLGDERIILSTWLDITERKRAEVALQEARRRLEVIVDSIADGFYALDREWRFTHANDAALRHMGKTREEILGRPLFDIYPETRNSVFETEYARAMESGEPRHFESPSLLTGRILEIYAYPGSDNLTVLFRDVTEKNRMVTALRESEEALREANESLEQRVLERTIDLRNLTEQLEKSRHELRKLASELVMAEERERKRIAGVLHDDIAQTLAAVRMRLEMLQEIPSDQKDTAMKDAKALLVQSIQETRALMNDLGNPLLFDMGLKPACEALASRLMERHPVRIHCDIRDTYKHLDPDMKTILYQVVRELLNNVVKHSRAQNAHVMIDMENEHFRVKVTDDGFGFNPQTLGAPTVEGGFGLYSIRERLIAVDGSLQIESAPGTGTVVTAILPAALD
jgi:PAS domain S-box-containing protein